LRKGQVAICNVSENGADLRKGQMAIHDDSRTGRCSTPRTDVNATQAHKLIFKDRPVTI
jgi:hypothetical protein